MAERSTLRYDALSNEVQERILADRARAWVNPWRCADEDAVRRDASHDRANLWRPAYGRDIEKILHLPFYNRYADKTQVFSFYRNDDLTRRALHVQLVSRIARNIGAVLGLNLDLIEAIALGHDIGHTPFGHAGERFLSELLQRETGRHFSHNAQSVRVLDQLFVRNFTLQTLDGVLCHNGEFELEEYRPTGNRSFEVLDAALERCWQDGGEANAALVPATLEGCVVRVCDIIAYLGKDRQDARTARIVPETYRYTPVSIGTENAAMINNLTVDLIEHSYGRDCICLSREAYQGLKTAKDENYRVIYKNEAIDRQYRELVRPMFEDVYYRLLDDLRRADERSVIYQHHIAFVEQQQRYYRGEGYRTQEPNQIVVDYIASMTDDYFLSLHELLFPDSRHRIEFHDYFEGMA